MIRFDGDLLTRGFNCLGWSDDGFGDLVYADIEQFWMFRDSYDEFEFQPSREAVMKVWRGWSR